jgi:glyoxylase I family protein
MIRGVHHTAFSTPDLDRLLHFYCDLLGAEKLSDSRWGPGNRAINQVLGLPETSGRSSMVRLGNLQLELWQFETPDPGSRPTHPPASQLGLTHICIEVDDVDQEYARLGAAGIAFHTAPMTFGKLRATYGRDPDDNIFELLQQLD